MVSRPDVGKGAKDGDDPWDVKEVESSEKAWAERTTAEKWLFVQLAALKLVCGAALLYLFIIALSLMGSAFQILGGVRAGELFSDDGILSNPVAGLVVGILATVLVQSSSTSTSIIISLTATDVLMVPEAIPMIMGANIGTSVTNTIVSMAHASDRDQYRRAFAGATVHDCFNLLTVATLLPAEALTGLLRHLSSALVDASGVNAETAKTDKVDFLKVITKPVTSRIVQIDKKLVEQSASETDPDKLAKLMKMSMIKQSAASSHLFSDTPMSDTATGVLLLAVSLLALSASLILLVKLLQSVFRGSFAVWLKCLLNLDFKKVPLVGDLLLIVFGTGITILMQSSSITTSALTPLVGIGLIRLDKMLPLTIGANIGTTFTGIVAALASSNIVVGLQVAFVHLSFNVVGMLIWFLLPCMRRVPLAMARLLGGLAADLRLFPLVYIALVFGLLPTGLLMLSLAGETALLAGGVALLVVAAGLILLHVLRQTRPCRLPSCLLADSRCLPTTLRTNQLDGTSSAPHPEADAKTAGAGHHVAAWWQGPSAWALGWLALMMLAVAVPNAQWASIQYAEFDPRPHVGIGLWQACSKTYTAAMPGMLAVPPCPLATLEACAGLQGCEDDPEFSERPGAHATYELSWANCSRACLTSEWQSHCVRRQCGGALHDRQCHNVTHGVQGDYLVTYWGEEGLAWEEGTACRPTSLLCRNHDVLAMVGVFVLVGSGAAALGQALLLSYAFLRARRSVAWVLRLALAAFALAWLALLVTWATFTDALGRDTVCTVVDESGQGAVLASGEFGHIAGPRGSYSFGLVCAAFALVTALLPVIAHRAWLDLIDQDNIPTLPTGGECRNILDEAVVSEASPEKNCQVEAAADERLTRVAIVDNDTKDIVVELPQQAELPAAPDKAVPAKPAKIAPKAPRPTRTLVCCLFYNQHFMPGSRGQGVAK